MSETINLNPYLQPEIGGQLELDVPPEVVAQFEHTFDEMVDKHGKDVTLVGVDDSFHGQAFARTDKEGNQFGVSRNTATGELKVYTTSKTEEGERTDNYSMSSGVLFYENPAQLVAKPGSFEVVERTPKEDHISGMRANLIPPSKEQQENMVNGFISKALAFEKSQGRPASQVRRLGRHILRMG